VKTMICDICGEVGDVHGDVIVGCYHISLHLQEVTLEDSNEHVEAIEGYIDMCSSCATTYMDKITEHNV